MVETFKPWLYDDHVVRGFTYSHIQGSFVKMLPMVWIYGHIVWSSTNNVGANHHVHMVLPEPRGRLGETGTMVPLHITRLEGIEAPGGVSLRVFAKPQLTGRFYSIETGKQLVGKNFNETGHIEFSGWYRRTT